MKRALLLVLAAATLCSTAPAPAEESGAAAAAPRVALETTMGAIVLELDAAKAPQTVASFLDNVDQGFYEDTVFHRVIPGFMVQGGGFDTEMRLKPTAKTLTNEADNGLKNDRGTVAMARKGDPHSASVQFFINLVDNEYLNHSAKTPRGWGYAVFGRVVEGMDVVDAIAGVRTATVQGMQNAPVEPVVVMKATVVEAGE